MTSTQSQCAEILRALKAGDRITPIDALHRFGCFRLSARILELKQADHVIEMELVDVGGKHVAEYRLARQKRRAA
jgi:hypothetical protein